MKLHIPLFLIFVAHSVFISAQITANKNSGCAPLTGVLFSSPTAGNWDFGNGTSAIDKSNVSATFGYPGIYTVTLTNNSGDTLDQDTITVFGNPTADFNTVSQTSGCAPFSVSFIDASTAGTSSIVDWDWAFVGTSTGSSEQNPIHTFTEKGEWTVILIIEDDNGCIDDTIKTDFISVTDPPIANFTASPLSSCTTPLIVNLNNTSTNSSGGTNNLTYEWDFGDSQTSTSQNLGSHEYDTIGNLTLSLTVSEDGGCTDKLTRSINIGSLEAIINSPDTIYINAYTRFFGNSNGGLSYKWTFDDGGVITNSTDRDPLSVYNSAGDQKVTLIVNNAECSDTTSKIVFVQASQVLCIYYDTIAVYDTITYYDTIKIAVTDTLIINAEVSGLNSPNNMNTLKVYPNPANDVVIIDNGDFSLMSDYKLKIVNSLGAEVFNSFVSIPKFQITVSSIGGNGLYYIQIFDESSSLLTTKKLILK